MVSRSITLNNHKIKVDTVEPVKRYPRKTINRQFIAWDGEGITPENAHQQEYVLFGNSEGYRVSSYSLSTDECFEVMFMTEKAMPLAIHVGFAFSYDVEMILRDVPMETMRILHREGRARWKNYGIEFRKGKWFQVTEFIGDTKTTIRIWDVFSFFSTSFVKALREYLGNDDAIDEMEKNKADRSTFTYNEIDVKIIPYWQSELTYMVRLMDSLRVVLYNADLKIYNWHGPGALATYAMKRKRIHEVKGDTPKEVNLAAQYAYGGGRFELLKIGVHDKPSYSYDIRSAYPSAIRYLPNLATGYWEHVENPTEVAEFGVYRIRYAHGNIMTYRPMPFYYRDMRDGIHFPNMVEGWYWSPEASMTKYMGNDAAIVEGWVYHHDGSQPFEWIEDTYNLRAKWKSEGNPSQLALKLLMNSMYGKFAQRVGFTGKDAPTWHQLEWAGWITSHCRAKIYKAMLEAHSKGALIAVETDGIFTSEKLDTLHVGKNLGDWEMDEYESLVYLQSGFCYKKQNGEWSTKSRGFDKGTVPLEMAMETLREWEPWNNERRVLVGESTRFTSMGQWLNYGDENKWRRTWNTTPRELRMGSDGKRVHRPDFCKPCEDQIPLSEMMHPLTIAQPVCGFSMPHKLPWLVDLENQFSKIDDGISK